MSLTTAAVQVGTSNPAGVLIAASGTAGLKRTRDSKIFNNGPQPIAVGPTPGVTLATGYIIPAGQSMTIDKDNAAVYAICSVAQVSPADTRVFVKK